MVETNRKPAVTVVLPAFNEAEVVGETVKRIRELHPDFEVLVVDDGSTDSTMQAAMDAGANVWPHPYNMGNGAAVKSGLRAARGDYVVLMDADGQHDPADIARLLEQADHFDMVVGARTKASKTKAHRNLANGIYNRFASYVTKFKIEDLTSGFRVMRRSTVEQYIYLLPNTFSYPSTITMAYLRSGRSVAYVPIETARRVGKSKIKLVRDGTRFLLIITKIATLFAPLRIFMPVSLVFFLLGLGYYAFTYLTQGRFTNMSALLLNSSVIVFLIGLVSEQVTQLKYERTK
ncbi:MAG: glycosyltransferase family 2 protein [Desulfofustis sp. PB-SRB1]|jgi:glycosyltransferase involved in cell wall biosynthesis|nr:glycosyltransferase family 2 protein [Desulfofustis sp. PB-SRB1]MBM1001871.1 glycosyltransferase family 2 protein [Desulfofustis sp. PB-SRB1]